MNKQKIKHGLVIVNTGKGKAKAPAALIEYAGLVTEMVKVKHPYQKGIQTQPGIEF